VSHITSKDRTKILGVDNPALYRLMFGGSLSGPDSSRPAVDSA